MPDALIVLLAGFVWLLLVGIWTCVRAYRAERVRMAAWHKHVAERDAASTTFRSAA